ncbi:MAG: aminomethyl-transferring glycine dehydrogenase subunit GcvPA [Candidatus Nezhaarchaeales archaeon]
MFMASPYIPNDPEEVRSQMLKSLGLSSVEELFVDIPEEVKLKRSLALPGPLSEVEVRKEVERILKKNRTVKELLCFLGAGVYRHYVPAAVDFVASRSEFLTSYTPYQAEVNQGMLQALFEYQSMICELTAMDVANSSMYDWASALGEAARMAARVTSRYEFVVPHYISPERYMVLRSYAEPAGIRIVEAPQDRETGRIDLERLKAIVSSKTAAVYIENPSYLGFVVDNADEVAEVVHDVGGLYVVGVDPTSLGVLKPPGDYGADIVIGEGQPLGNYMNFGGPLLGIFACRDDPRLVRQMPGRLIGVTTTVKDSDRGFCMVLQTREQHIRRERATSNICTNEALCALRAAVYMALLGKNGFKELGELIATLTNYAIKLTSEVKGVKAPLFKAFHFKEFTVNLDGAGLKVSDVNKELLKLEIQGGKDLSNEYPELGQTALYCVTEEHTEADLRRLQRSLKLIVEGSG